MRRLIIRLILNAVSIYLAAFLLTGMIVNGPEGAVISAFAFGIMNTFVRPILFLLTLPLTILTLGLFTLVINGLTLALTAWVIDSLQVTSLGTAILGALLISLFNWLLGVNELKERD